MIVFTCVDNNNGMLFNNRRQSKDLAITNKIKDIILGNDIFLSEYSQTILPEGKVNHNLLECEGFVFIEDPVHFVEEKIEQLYIFKWNRNYPSDKKFNVNLSNFSLISTEDFTGNSHDCITLEIYKRKEMTL